MAGGSFRIKVGLDADQAKRALASLGRDAQGLAGKFGRAAKATAMLGAAAAAAASAFAAFQAIRFIKDSSAKAADFEQIAVAFEQLLGSASAAGKRLAELQEFSIRTPFEPREIQEASKLLQTMAGDTLATGEGLRMIGDAAAVAGQPLSEVALQVGRVFGAFTEGGVIGQELNRLQELGLISGKVKKSWAELADAVRKGGRDFLTSGEAMAVLSQAFARTEGAMDKLSATFGGKLSTLKGNVDLLKIALGEGINEGLKGAVDAMNTKLPEFQEGFRMLGEKAGNLLADGLMGNTEAFEAIGKYFVAMAKAEILAAAAFGTTRTGTTLGARFATGGVLGPSAEDLRNRSRFDYGDFQRASREFQGIDRLRENLRRQLGVEEEWVKLARQQYEFAQAVAERENKGDFRLNH